MKSAQINQTASTAPKGGNTINQPSTYTVEGRKFIVTPVFSENGTDTFGTIFLRLLKAEAAARH